MLYALLPVKQLSLAKRRLSGVLNESERQALFMAMLEDVLQQLISYTGIEKAFVITRDPLVKLLAGRYGVICLHDDGQNLNQAFSAGLRQLPADASQVLMLHGDLPLLSHDALDHFLAHPETVLMATDRQQQGTNLMRLGWPQPAFRLHYGLGSCALHQQQAQACGLSSKVVSASDSEHTSMLSLDIDQPHDLLALIRVLEQHPQQSCTATYLSQSRIVSRLSAMSLDANLDNHTVTDVLNHSAVESVK